MFNRSRLVLLLLLIAGCGASSSTTLPPEGPLSVEEWKAMTDVGLKYDPTSFDRLKKANPKLEDEKAWDQFMKDVILPQRQIDVPPVKYHN